MFEPIYPLCRLAPHLVDVRHGVAPPGIVGLQPNRLPADLLGAVVEAELLEREGMAAEHEAGSRYVRTPLLHDSGAERQHAGRIAQHEAQRMGEFERQEGRRSLGKPVLEQTRCLGEGAADRPVQRRDQNTLIAGAAVAAGHCAPRIGERLARRGDEFRAGEDQACKTLERKSRHMSGVSGQGRIEGGSGRRAVRSQAVGCLLEGGLRLFARRAGG